VPTAKRSGPGPWVSIVGVAFCGAWVLFYAWLSGGSAPRIGHDYAYFHERLIEGADYLWKNGGIQYWSRLCGGLPAYGNPQSMQLSVPQLLFLFLAPASAVFVSVAIFGVAGFVGCWLLLRRSFGIAAGASLSGAALFTANGFYLANVLIGHLPAASFMLIPGVLHLLYRAGERPRFGTASLARVVAASLVAASFVYAGGTFVAWALVASAGLFALCFRRFDAIAVGAMAATAALLSASKLTAVASFEPILFHAYIAEHPNGLGDALVAGLAQLFAPPTLGASGGLSADFGWWELTSFVSPVVLLPFLLPKTRASRFTVWQRVVFGGAALFLLLLAGGHTPLVHANASLPLLSSIWVVPRYGSLLVLPVVVLFADALDRARVAGRPATGPLATSLLCVTILSSVGLAFHTVTFRWEPARSAITHEPVGLEEIHTPLPKVTRFASEEGPSQLDGAVPLVCYEPSLGYELEGAAFRVRYGPIEVVESGTFNMTHPACLVYGAANGCEPWSLVPADQGAALARFLDNRDPNWPVSGLQRAANTASAIALTASLALLAAWLVRACRARGE
jgi:hypothetical protein